MGTVKQSHSLETWYALADVDPVGTFNKLVATLNLENATAQLILTDCEGDHHAACKYLLENKLSASPPPPAKKKITLGTIIGYLFLCFILISAYGIIKDTFLFPLIYPPPPTLTRPVFTQPATSVALSATPARSCTHWAEITATMKGQQLCVYGKVATLREYLGASQIRFGGDDEFFFSSGAIYYPEVQPAACVFATGEILLSAEDVPYINVDENPVYLCDPWMKSK